MRQLEFLELLLHGEELLSLLYSASNCDARTKEIDRWWGEGEQAKAKEREMLWGTCGLSPI
jgi:hypothetical protein